uniref:Endoplasmic reticulum-Golgi intermediate compartment protein n=1 Tax=Canis lupus familiaris TaxID=9615 RepID=A0A8I3S2Z5_CANLF
MRRLNRKKTLSLVKELDAFPKVPDSYVETSASGGTVSLIAFTTMALLTIMEFSVYQDTWMKYEYEVDKDFSSLALNMECKLLIFFADVGADVLDLAETMVASADGLVYEPAIFDLSPQQKEWQRMLQLIQSRLQEEHSLQDVIFKSAFKSASTALPPRAIPHPRGHAHLAALVNHDSYNFSHRIDHLSFGEVVPGIINPLDGTEKIAVDRKYLIITVGICMQERVINHAAGSHGVSGIFMKYDLSSLMVTVTEEHMPFWQFFVRLCGIVGGIFSTTGIFNCTIYKITSNGTLNYATCATRIFSQYCFYDLGLFFFFFFFLS